MDEARHAGLEVGGVQQRRKVAGAVIVAPSQRVLLRLSCSQNRYTTHIIGRRSHHFCYVGRPYRQVFAEQLAISRISSVVVQA